MFELEDAITQWRERLTWRGAFTETDLDEMESHLRDEVEASVATGEAEQEAFFSAVRRFGEDTDLARGYNLANWEAVTIKRARFAPMLISNYVKVAIRNLFAYKLYSCISILGLAVGLAAVTLAAVYIRYELSYEDVHVKKDRIYRVIRKTTRDGDSPNYHWAETSGALAAALRSEFPEIEHAALVNHSPVSGKIGVVHDGRTFQQHVVFADSSFFDMFTFPLVTGSVSSLHDPSAILITEEAARKIFGDRDPIGEELKLEGNFQESRYTITGIVQNLPGKSRFRFDLFRGLPQTRQVRRGLRSWRVVGWVETYVLLKEGADPKSFEAKLPAFAERHLEPKNGVHVTYDLQPLSRVRLHSGIDYDIPRRGIGSIEHVYLAAWIAILVTLSACLNFIILSTARSADRAREIGIRKVSGAIRSALVRQFLGEAVIISTLALAAGVLLARMLLPTFSDLVYPTYQSFTGHTWGGVHLSIDVGILPTLCGLTVLIGLLAGSYPAFMLSGFQPIAAVQASSPRVGGRNLRRTLVVLQFALAVAITIGTWTVYRQVQYVGEKDLGYKSDHVIGLMQFYANQGLRPQYETIKHEFLQHPNITSASGSDMIVGGRMQDVYPEGAGEESVRMTHVSVDEDYLAMFDIDLVAGRNFRAGPDDEAYLLNEAAVKFLGWTDPIGKRFDAFESGMRPGSVVGVVENFHFESLREPVRPMFLTKQPKSFLMLWLKLEAAGETETLAFIDDMQRRLLPDSTPERKFLDDVLAEYYRDDRRLQRVLVIFGSVAIAVACMGVFGFVCYTAQQRSREIAVRKTLGASDASIVRLLSWDFVGLVVVANVFAWPVAYWFLRQWLNGFAYRTDMSLTAFLLCGATVLGLATAAAAQQGYRAATANPVDALRAI